MPFGALFPHTLPASQEHIFLATHPYSFWILLSCSILCFTVNKMYLRGWMVFAVKGIQRHSKLQFSVLPHALVAQMTMRMLLSPPEIKVVYPLEEEHCYSEYCLSVPTHWEDLSSTRLNSPHKSLCLKFSWGSLASCPGNLINCCTTSCWRCNASRTATLIATPHHIQLPLFTKLHIYLYHNL